MDNDSMLKVPLLARGWRFVAIALFPLPAILVIGLAFARTGIDPNEAAQVIYGFWAMAFGILNLTKEKQEDEMIQRFRLQAFQTGFYWLIWGLGALMLINYVRYDRLTSEIFTAYLVLFLLNLYIYAAFQLQLYKSRKEN
ncbi:hypothetical protein [Algoriphagus sp. PAP.12]|uniref:hypothetical protein n=1 Tax=Algoriphagus sp. PAP.12 TaxID=2996678 RepID=UPI00227B1086|nr:hypothetical protein [Algoriphagus sp. PAP.12]